MKTRQRQVAHCLCSPVSERDDVINREPHILPLLYSVAILAEVAGPLPYLLLKGSREFAPSGQPLNPIPHGLGLEKVPDHAVHEAEIVIDLFIAVQFLFFLCTQCRSFALRE